MIMFKVESNEIFYIYKKVERDYVDAFQPHTDKFKVMNLRYIEQILEASNELVNKHIDSYINMLIEQLKPE